jgi:hypothetical protein
MLCGLDLKKGSTGPKPVSLGTRKGKISGGGGGGGGASVQSTTCSRGVRISGSNTRIYHVPR